MGNTKRSRRFVASLPLGACLLSTASSRSQGSVSVSDPEKAQDSEPTVGAARPGGVLTMRGAF